MVGLVLIAKNEAHCLGRALLSVRPLIDRYTILLDQENTDASEDVIAQILGELPGEVVRRPWRGMSGTRNEAIEIASFGARSGDYLLTIDADDFLVTPSGYHLPPLHTDRIEIEYRDGPHGSECSYWRPLIFAAGKGIHYEGAAHEVLVGAMSVERLGERIYCQRTHDGASWRNPLAKHRRDARALEAELVGAALTDRSRHACYFAAQSWRDAADDLGWVHFIARRRACAKALALYEKRARMEGDAAEVFMSLLMAGKLYERLGSRMRAVFAYERAIVALPERAPEAAHDLVLLYRKQRRFSTSVAIGETFVGKPIPSSVQPVDRSIYLWRLELETATSAWWAGEYAKARCSFEYLLGVVPPEERSNLLRNIALCEGRAA